MATVSTANQRPLTTHSFRTDAFAPGKVPPLRKVVSVEVGMYRYETLDCGHSITFYVGRPLAKRRRCGACE